jgi:hypothetical protein
MNKQYTNVVIAILQALIGCECTIIAWSTSLSVEITGQLGYRQTEDRYIIADEPNHIKFSVGQISRIDIDDSARPVIHMYGLGS